MLAMAIVKAIFQGSSLIWKRNLEFLLAKNHEWLLLKGMHTY